MDTPFTERLPLDSVKPDRPGRWLSHQCELTERIGAGCSADSGTTSANGRTAERSAARTSDLTTGVLNAWAWPPCAVAVDQTETGTAAAAARASASSGRPSPSTSSASGSCSRSSPAMHATRCVRRGRGTPRRVVLDRAGGVLADHGPAVGPVRPQADHHPVVGGHRGRKPPDGARRLARAAVPRPDRRRCERLQCRRSRRPR